MPYCSVPLTVSKPARISIGGWKQCITVLRAAENMAIAVDEDMCKSNAFNFYRCNRRIENGKEI